MSLTENNCRFCLKECLPLDLDAEHFSLLYHQATGFVVQDTDIPRKICVNCRNFLEKFRSTEEILQEHRQSLLVDQALVQEESLEPEKLPAAEEELLPSEETVNENARDIDESIPEDAIFFDSEVQCQITCAYCNAKKLAPEKMMSHVLKSHAKKRWFTCPWCTYVCHSLDELREHCTRFCTTVIHAERITPFTHLQCDECNFKCCFQVTMEDHCLRRHSHHSLPCECGLTFVCHDIKLQHCLLRCQNSPKQFEFPYERFINPTLEETKKGKLVCSFCAREISCQVMCKHLQVCVKNPKGKHEMDNANDDTRKFLCQTCGVMYTRFDNLKDHILTQHDGSMFGCTQCTESFTTRKRLRNHIRKEHGGS